MYIYIYIFHIICIHGLPFTHFGNRGKFQDRNSLGLRVMIEIFGLQRVEAWGSINLQSLVAFLPPFTQGSRPFRRYMEPCRNPSLLRSSDEM